MKTSTIVSSALVLAAAATQGVYSMPVVQTPAIDTRSTLSDMDMSQYFKTSLEQDLQRGGSAGRGRGGGGRGGSARGGYYGRVVEIQFGKREEVARCGDSGAVRGGASVRGGTSDRGGSTRGGGRGGGLGRPDSDKLQNIIATIKGAIRGAISDRGSTRGGTSSRGRGRGTSRPVEDVLDEQKQDTESGLVERSSDSQSTPSDFTKRYVQGFVAPSGYNYSWVIDGYRLALDASGIKSYITRSTISKDASSTTQTHVNQCVGLCEKQVGCAMASIIRFNNFSEGNVICALYNATAPKSEAKYTTGMWNGAGTVSASYTFNRNAGQVKALTTTTTTRASTSTTSAASTSPTTDFASSSTATTASATSSTTSSSTMASSNTSSTSVPSTTATVNTAAAKIYDSWQFIDVPGTTCADGSQTGFALNLHSSSTTDLIIGFQEGGSCYDYNTCYVQKKAYNIASGFSNSTFWAQSQPANLKGWFPFARDNQWNPWQKANYAWIPYCTGDYHSGDNSVLYDGSSVTTHHRGWRNSKLDLAKIKELVPGVQRVWITGSSAGGFASILQYQNAQDAFPGIRVDLLADSGISPNPITRHPSQNVQVPDKSRCPNCNDASFDSYIVGLAQANPGSRFASMSWANDTTIPVNQGISFDAFAAEITRLFNEQNSKTSNARNFKVPGSGHTLMYNTQYNAADGYTQATFLNKFKTDDAGWGSH